MAELFGNLWEYNMAKVVVIDVTDDYKLMQPPLPSECYPVLAEVWVPTYNIDNRLSGGNLVDDYLYDWHETPEDVHGVWYVGVVHRGMLASESAQG